MQISNLCFVVYTLAFTSLASAAALPAERSDSSVSLDGPVTKEAISYAVWGCIDANFQGDCRWFSWAAWEGDCYNIPSKSKWNDALTSLMVTLKDERCRFYQHGDCQGRESGFLRYGQDIANLKTKAGNFNDVISSIRCWRL
ncbi:hypothetical protein BJ508DRAFT_356872 [Ascobolus immersus RN42]|uniref:Uncharacterized protein n=1 Tax=Ascobolus immersus RN42 TaxID=1160509 RepID=A0A3N4IQX5_ASCIM|nr:hypothetical protein BJ508DRAFT_356872 [Ascobolus immersus RN42]